MRAATPIDWMRPSTTTIVAPLTGAPPFPSINVKFFNTTVSPAAEATARRASADIRVIPQDCTRDMWGSPFHAAAGFQPGAGRLALLCYKLLASRGAWGALWALACRVETQQTGPGGKAIPLTTVPRF